MTATQPETNGLHPLVELRDLGDVIMLRAPDGRSHVAVSPDVARLLQTGSRDVVDDVLDELVTNGFFDGSPSPAKRVVVTADGLEFDVIARPVGVIARPLARWWAGVRWVRIGLALLFVFGFGLTVYSAMLPATASSPRIAFLAIAVLGIFTALVHELSHAVVLAGCGRQVGRIGVGLYWGAPCFYVDSTDAHFLGRRQRVAQACAGVIGETVLAGPALSLLLLFDQQFAARTVALLSLTTFLVNASPVFKLDGYWALTDVMNRPRLAEETRHAVVEFLRRRPTDRRLVWWGAFSVLAGSVLIALSVVTWLGLRQSVIFDLWDGGAFDQLIAALMVVPLAATVVGGLLAYVVRFRS